MRTSLLSFILILVSFFNLSSAQSNSLTSNSEEATQEQNIVTPQAYAGLNGSLVFIFPLVSAHIGANDVFIENFGIRLDAITVFPYTTDPIFGLSLNGLYNFYEVKNLSLYVGGGPRAIFNFTSEPRSDFTYGMVIGGEISGDSIAAFGELDLSYTPELDYWFGLSAFPIVRFGVSIPF